MSYHVHQLHFQIYLNQILKVILSQQYSNQRRNLKYMRKEMQNGLIAVFVIIQRMHQSKLQEIDDIVYEGGIEMIAEEEEGGRQSRLVHTMRAVVVVIDVTKSMAMKDFKPSRLASAVLAVRQFLLLLKQSTPIVVAGVGLASQGSCRMLSQMTYNLAELSDKLDQLKLEDDPGSFSFESSLFQAIVNLDKLPTCFHRQIVMIQSSPMTKDQHNLVQTIDILKVSQAKLNVISFCGYTEAIKRSVQKLKGKYQTANNAEECIKMIKEFARPSDFQSSSVKMQLVKMGLVRKEQSKSYKYCICHFERVKTTYICTSCESTLCKEPPLQCPICNIILVMPTDLYNHTIKL